MKTVENLSNEELRDRLYKGFNNSICKECDRYIQSLGHVKTSPQPIQYIGSNFYDDIENPYRIMFVGKGTYNNDICKTYDIFPSERVQYLYSNNTKSFWSWVREILKKVFNNNSKEELFPYFAYSNFHKCQAAKDEADLEKSDYVIYETLSENCISKAGWIYKEIREINAKNIIVFSGFQDNHYLARLFLNEKNNFNLYSNSCRIKDEFKFNFDWYIANSKSEKRKKKLTKRKNGKYRNWDFFMHLRDGDRRIIITNHPQGTPREFCKEICRIIKKDDWSSAVEWKMPICEL